MEKVLRQIVGLAVLVIVLTWGASHYTSNKRAETKARDLDAHIAERNRPRTSGTINQERSLKPEDFAKVKDEVAKMSVPQMDEFLKTFKGGYEMSDFGLLYYAADSNNLKMAMVLTARGVRGDVRRGPSDRQRDSPLCAAARGGNVDIVRILLDAGTPPQIDNYPYGYNEIALAEAAEHNRVQVAQLLLSAHAVVDARQGAAGSEASHPSPLGYAAEKGNYEVAKILIEAKANPDFAIFDCPNPEIAKLLLDAGARVDRRKEGEDEATALMSAALNGYTETMKVLIARGADIEARDKRGCSAVFYALGPDQAHTDALRILVDAGANVNVNPNDGRLLRERASHWKNPGLLDVLNGAKS